MVADDFTGSADTANYFCIGGRKVRVSFDLEKPWDFSRNEQVVQVFDTESRAIAPDAARKRIYDASQQLVHHGVSHAGLYKKVDSTMRGHIGAEIEALLLGSGRQIALLAPAFPANGRTILNGKLFIDGTGVSQTAFSKDPHSPITQDDVTGIVQQTTQVPTSLMDLSVIHSGVDAIEHFLADVGETNVVIVADAQTDEDLAVIASVIANDERILPCGSAGLARQLAPIWCSPDIEHQPGDLLGELPACERVVVAVGSANPVAAEQLAYVRSRCQSSDVVMSPPKLAQSSTRSLAFEQAMHEIAEIDNQILTVSFSKERAVRSDSIPGTFERDLATVVHRYLEMLKANDEIPVGLVATGGDTAFALCHALSAKAFWPQGELVPGMPWSWLETELGMFPIVSKAGGFGTVDALHTAVTALIGQGLPNTAKVQFGDES